MKRFIISILIIIISLFFINSKANFKYNVNYITVNRHMDNTDRLKTNEVDIYNYIISETKNYDVEIEEYNDTIIITKISEHPEAKNIGFITNYNSFNSSNSNSLSLATMISTIQSYNNQSTSNNLYFIFSKNSEDYINDNITFLNSNPYILNKLDFVFSFNSIGNTGDVFINETSTINKDITKFFKSSVSSASGFSDISLKNNKVELNGVQSLTFGLLNNSHLELEEAHISDMNENTKNNYINTINELVISSHDYQFEESNGSIFYFNYFDSFISISNYATYIFLAISSILTVLFMIIHKDKVNVLNIILYTITNAIVLLFAFVISMLPLNKILNLINNNNAIVEDVLYLIILFSILLLATIIITLAKFRYDITFVQTIMSSIFVSILLLISFYMIFSKINVVFCMLMLILSISLYFANSENKSIERIITIVTIILLPIIIYEVYFLYALSSLTNVFTFAMTSAGYTLVILPIIIFFKKKKKKLI